MPDVTTASVVTDYIHYKLSSKGLDCPMLYSAEGTRQDSKTSLSSIQTAVRGLTHEIENRFRSESNGMAIMDSLHVTPGTASGIFHSVTYELFHYGRNAERSRSVIQPSWGRISSLLAFSGALAVHCVQNEMPQMVDQVANWTISYIDANLLEWVNRHGGWNGLIPPPDQAHDPWLTYRTVLGVAALGAVTALAVILVH